LTVHDETEIPMDNFFMAWTAYEFYYGKHYFFGGEDLREDKKKYNNYVFEFVGDKMEKLNIELPWAEFSRVSSAVHKGEVWLCGSRLGCPCEKQLHLNFARKLIRCVTPYWYYQFGNPI